MKYSIGSSSPSTIFEREINKVFLEYVDLYLTSEWGRFYVGHPVVSKLSRNKPLLWNPNIHYHIHKSPSLLHIMSNLNPIYTPNSTSLRTFLILHPINAYVVKNFVCISYFPMRTTCPAHCILLDLIIVISGEGNKLCRASLCSFFHFAATLHPS
jgi:hypothetical protein